MASAKVAFVDPATSRIYPDIMPTTYATTSYVDTTVTTAVAGLGGGSLSQAQLDAALATTEWIWNTTTGGVREDQGGVRNDATGTYAAHPVTARSLRFNNPAVKPLGNGNRVAGGGEMVPGYDSWVGPA